MKLAEIATLTVTARLSEVSVMTHRPVAEPVSTPATPVQANAVVALEALVGVQPDMPVRPVTDHEYVYGPTPPDTTLAVVEFVVMLCDRAPVALTEEGDVWPTKGGPPDPASAQRMPVMSHCPRRPTCQPRP